MREIGKVIDAVAFKVPESDHFPSGLEVQFPCQLPRYGGINLEIR